MLFLFDPIYFYTPPAIFFRVIPLIISVHVLCVFIGLARVINLPYENYSLYIYSFLVLLRRVIIWRVTLSYEVTIFRISSFIIFLVSEIVLFGAIFSFVYYYRNLPLIHMGFIDTNLVLRKYASKISIPLVNTRLLLSSRLIVHIFLYSSKQKLATTMASLLGIVFIGFQFYEYYSCPLTITDISTAGVFYLLTGFHGLHVLVGVFLLNTAKLQEVVEIRSIYWHFVDII